MEESLKLYVLVLSKLKVYIFGRFNFPQWLSFHFFDSMTVEILVKGFISFQNLIQTL